MWTDVRHAARWFRRHPATAFAIWALLSLALAGNIATFSIVDANLLRPLPHKAPANLVEVWFRTSTPERRADIRALPLFSGLETYELGVAMSATRAGQREELWVGQMSPGMLALLGLAPSCGRGFQPGQADTRDVVMISERYWTRAFGRDPAAVGRALVIEGRTYTIVGVAPPGLRYVVGVPFGNALDNDAWLPARNGWAIARLKEGITLQQARQRSRSALAALAAQKPDIWSSGELRGFRLEPFGSQFPIPTRAILALWLAVGAVLFIAYANVGGLLLHRALTHESEVVVRAWLGATRLQLVRQFVVEGAMLSAASGVAAMVLARWALDLLPVIAPFALGRVSAVRTPAFDGRAMAFALLATLLTAVVCAMAPMVRASKCSEGGLRSGASVIGQGERTRRLARALEIGQVGATVLLLVGCGLLLANLVRMVRLETGFRLEGLVHAEVAHTTRKAVTADVMRDVVTRVKAMPGVEAATLGPPPPSMFGARVDVPGSPGTEAVVAWTSVPWDYFSVAGIHLVTGRGFAPHDSAGERLAVVSESMARNFWQGQPALGQRLRLFDRVSRVIGIARDVKLEQVHRPGMIGQVWLLQRADDPGTSWILVRTSGSPGAVAQAISQVATSLDPALGVSRGGPVSQMYETVFAPARFYATLAAMLAAFALLIATVGLYALVSFYVTTRRQEIALRVAVGADAGQIRQWVVRQALRPVGMGIGLGVAATWTVKPLLTRLAIDGTQNVIVLLLASSLIVAVAALVALIGPLRRAVAVDPIVDLRAI